MIRTHATHETHAWYAQNARMIRTHDTHACYARNARMIRTHATHETHAWYARMIRTHATHETHTWYAQNARMVRTHLRKKRTHDTLNKQRTFGGPTLFARTSQLSKFLNSFHSYLWLTKTSQQPTNQTTWLKVTPIVTIAIVSTHLHETHTWRMVQ